MKHLTVRFAWHDNKWNGKICKNPRMNFYCRGNYSLLSPRIQKRINLEIEEKTANSKISEVIGENNYFPPCYWCINALGEKTCIIKDPHPFIHSTKWGKDFQRMVSPLEEKINSYALFSWCFLMSFEHESPTQIYPPISELEKRAKKYIQNIKGNESVVFFYANYSNPITGDDYKYCLLGAALVKEVEEPKRYQIPDELLRKIRNEPGMNNFPTIAWQFKIKIDPKTAFVLPFHEYLEWLAKDKSLEEEKKWKKLKEISTPVIEHTLIPHFKYVSMHLSHDKCIYLLYYLQKSVKKMKEHQIVDYKILEDIEKKIDGLLSIAWRERGRYPGFRNLLFTYLKHDYPEDSLTIIINEFEKWVRNTYGDLDNFLADVKNIKDNDVPSQLIKVIVTIKRNLDEIKFLSQFDLTIPQLENIKADILSKIGLDELKSNPYLLFEKYSYDKVYTWDIDKSDYGIDLYDIDIALIPDIRYAKWSTEYSAQSPQRIRALIVKILNDAASQNGDSCLVKSDILKRIEDYPLYYINERFGLNERTLIDYEKETLFKERFVIKTEFQNAIYQLKELREIEKHIENVINKLVSKKYEPDHEYMERVIREEKEKFKDRINIGERRRAYIGALSNGLFILTGKAGSGKTQAIVELVKKFIEENKVPIYIFTPTGKANLVIKNRIKSAGIYNSNKINISTIHRFLYRSPAEYIQYIPAKRHEIYQLTDLVSDILSGRWDLFKDFSEISRRGWRFNPSVVIIDETSMVDKILLGALFCMINIDNLKHLILVGDEKQLPPIGVGRPLADIIFYLRKKGMENIVRLESNLRFSPDSGLGMLTELFGGDDPPSIIEIEQILKKQDESFKIDYFTDIESLKGKTADVLRSLLHQSKEESIFNLFGQIFKGEGNKISLDRVQIISPRRVGNFGTMAINQNVIMNGNIQFLPQTKLICEENIYYTISHRKKDERILALANGSIGYLDDEGYIRFDEIDELKASYGWQKIKNLIFNIKNEIYSPLQTDRRIDLGYAITAHKSQGSDFDNVIFIFPEVTPFITKELMYTALTRAKSQLHIFVNEDLKQELPLILSRIYDNSAIEQRKTLLFEFKISPSRAYYLQLRDGRTLQLRSKIEYIIANILDKLGIKFEYEPEDFWLEYRIKPDFKLIIDGESYYWEHLGLMEYGAYRNRWSYKKQIYEELGIIDKLITTTEGEKMLKEESIKDIINDLKSRNLKTTENSYSKHHYEI